MTPQDELLCTYAALILHDDGAASWMMVDFETPRLFQHGGIAAIERVEGCFPTKNLRFFSRAVRSFSPELMEFLMMRSCCKEKSSKKADLKSSVVSNDLIVCFQALRV